MPMYIKEGVWTNILRVFAQKQDQNKQSKLIKNMRKTNPALANAFQDWDNSSYKLLQATKATLQKYGKSTADVDDLLKDYE